jgi:hypothetical protein
MNSDQNLLLYKTMSQLIVEVAWNVKSNQEGVHDGSILVFALLHELGFKALRKNNGISLSDAIASMV